MKLAYQQILAAAFVLIALIPIRSYNSIDDRAMHLGFVVGLALNLYFYFQLGSPDGMRRFRDWHLPIAFDFPALVVWPFTLAVIPAKWLLKGSTPMKQWGAQEARSLLAREPSILRRALVRTYLAGNPPMLFLWCWALCSLAFVRIVFNNH